jgi:hypothetical protein
MRLLLAIFIGLSAASFSSSTQAAPKAIKTERCKKVYDQTYMNRRSPKAYALSANGEFCGWAAGYLSKNIAKKEALRNCDKRARRAGVGKCKIISVK